MYYYNTFNSGAPVNSTNDIAVRDIPSTTCTGSIPNFPAAPLPFDPTIGELSYEKHFNQASQVLKTIFYYPLFNEAPEMATPGFIVSTVLGFSGQYLGTKYTLNTSRRTYLETDITDFDPANSNSVITIKRQYFASPYHHQETRSLTTTSMGDSLISNTKYSSDYRLTTCDAISDCSSEYNTACSSCQSTYNSAITACAGNTACVTTADTAYWSCNNRARMSYTTCRINYMSNSSTSYQYCITNAESTADANLKPLLQLQDAGRLEPIEVSDWKDANFLHSSFTYYGYSSNPVGIPYPAKTQLVNLQAPSSSFTNSTVSGSTLTKDSRYLDESSYGFSAGTLAQVTTHDGLPVSYLWDYTLDKPIAKVSNATIDQVAYTSFEADGKGSWTFAGAPANDSTAPTGNKTYSLSLGAVSKSGLTSSNAYVISYWSNNGSLTISGSAINQGKTINMYGTNWTFYEHTIGGITSVSLTGTGKIDELRLYPSNAQMTTYTYSPLVGMTSSCDVDNRITYYFFDGLGRLNWIKDQDGNIIKTIKYHYTGIPTP